MSFFSDNYLSAISRLEATTKAVMDADPKVTTSPAQSLLQANLSGNKNTVPTVQLLLQAIIKIENVNSAKDWLNHLDQLQKTIFHLFDEFGRKLHKETGSGFTPNIYLLIRAYTAFTLATSKEFINHDLSGDEATKADNFYLHAYERETAANSRLLTNYLKQYAKPREVWEDDSPGNSATSSPIFAAAQLQPQAALTKNPTSKTAIRSPSPLVTMPGSPRPNKL